MLKEQSFNEHAEEVLMQREELEPESRSLVQAEESQNKFACKQTLSGGKVSLHHILGF